MAADETEITLGEVARKVDAMTLSVDRLSTRVDERPNWKDLQAAVEHASAARSAMERRITVLEQWQTWASRLVGGTLVSGLITAVFVLKP